MMVIDNKYNFGDVVYLKTDKEQLPRLVVRLAVNPHQVLYCLAAATVETWHLDLEFSYEQNIVLKTDN